MKATLAIFAALLVLLLTGCGSGEQGPEAPPLRHAIPESADALRAQQSVQVDARFSLRLEGDAPRVGDGLRKLVRSPLVLAVRGGLSANAADTELELSAGGEKLALRLSGNRRASYATIAGRTYEGGAAFPFQPAGEGFDPGRLAEILELLYRLHLDAPGELGETAGRQVYETELSPEQTSALALALGAGKSGGELAAALSEITPPALLFSSYTASDLPAALIFSADLDTEALRTIVRSTDRKQAKLLRGVEGAVLSFSLRFSDWGEPVLFTTPANRKRLSSAAELERRLGSGLERVLDALG